MKDSFQMDGQPCKWQRPRKSALRVIEKNFLLSCVLAAATTYLLVGHFWHHPSLDTTTQSGYASLLPEDLEYGLAQCAANQERPAVDHGLASIRLAKPRSGVRTILYHATLIDGDGKVTPDCTIEMQDGIITAVVASSSALDRVSESSDTIKIDLEGRIVTPGLVDIHSHIGIRPTPQLWATEDVTEYSSMATPWGRAIDAIKPNDPAFPVVASGGVTTSLVLTGAKNSMSGEGAVLKMKRAESVYDLLVNLTEAGGKPQRYLKMAMGENQKRQFQNVPGGLVSRQGESFVYRKAYDTARRVKQRQDMWCEAASTALGRASLTEEYPRSLEWQTLVDVLRGDVSLHIHGYETVDILAMFDHSDEFGFNITALHHGLHADSITDEVRKRNIAVVGFTDSWGDKKENYNVTLYFPKRIVDAGIPLALTRDAPALHGQFLIYEAQIAHHFGVSAETAFSSVMAVPARLMGMDNRIGFIRPGYDADLVVWDRHPLRVGAAPLEVFIDGSSVVRASSDLWRRSQDFVTDAPPSRPEAEIKTPVSPVGHADVVLKGIVSSFVGKGGKRGEEIRGSDMTAVIRDGNLVCIGETGCTDAAAEATLAGAPVVQVNNGVVIPGLTIVTRQHGLVEMALEPSTGDGASSGANFDNPPEAQFGLTFGGIHVQSAHHAGVTRIVTPPLTTGFFHGISTRFRAGAKSVLDDGAVSDPNVALHFTIGHEGKGPVTPSVTLQIQKLRELLTTEQPPHSVYRRAARGEIPVVVHVHNKDVIAHMIALKHETNAHIVIMGAAEAHLHADALAKADIPVIVAPFWGCEPLFWDARHCLPGPPLVDALGPQVLVEAGVTVGIASWDTMNNHIQSSIWEAGWLAGPANHSLALDLVTRNVEKALKLSETGDIVVFEGNPFDFGARVALSFEEGRVQSVYPNADATE
ncbi:uncharacterized protein E0L32_011346 [Thyridium curvatum]|uniref:Amidohydrolase-related domain-containing protein n=1 Tax=Thyridium curvatum TaxID=1093900 RepID=A0A507BHG4_9PEZI|nr:uncharacterized protein E0L32_011346 [Thyridium curvatum]TPX18953.1 hypothetical protein E0L32_011346 [Thyridium curvatum]